MKTKRQVIKIDETLCNGCGACITGCHEGALQLLDGKARMISDLYCDGLGACIGECPTGAISFEMREAEPYDENAVMARIYPKGEATILAHLKHLKDHNEKIYVEQGIEYIRQNNLPIDLELLLAKLHDESIHSKTCENATSNSSSNEHVCPGQKERTLVATNRSFQRDSCTTRLDKPLVSQLRQWPIQLHLQNIQASYFQKANVILAADCTAFAHPDFHNYFIQNHTLSIACPKLDNNKEAYIAKITEMIDSALIDSLTIIIMEVPCCNGLVQLARRAMEQASRTIPVKAITISLDGVIINEKQISLNINH